jgi:hypothetical protein
MVTSSGSSHLRSIGAPNPQLSKSIERIGDSWFPVNPSLLKRIRSGLADGAYDLDIDFLLTEIQSDFALFTFCLKELREALARHSKPSPENLTPLEMLRYAGKDVLSDILSASGEEISSHNFESENPSGMIRIRESMISAGTADALAQRSNLPESLGFSTALLRQLGLTLIAWNYPKIFERCSSSLREGDNLEDKLSEALGFHPQLIPITLAKQWKLLPEIRSSLGDSLDQENFPREQAAEIHQITQQLTTCCEVGEALARASSPDIYPDAAHDWSLASEEIARVFGEGGMRFIQKHVLEQCQQYRDFYPHAFESLEHLDESPRRKQLDGNGASVDNKYLRSCPGELQKQLLDLYQHIHSGAISQTALDLLFQTIIPSSGFSSGCVYMLDPASMELRPRIHIGDHLSDSTPRARHAFSLTTGIADPVLEAFSCSTPILRSRKPGVESSVSSISFVVTPAQRIGVFYLELSSNLERNAGSEALLMFRALHKAFCDCLHLHT